MAITWSAARDKVRGDLWRTSSGIPDDVLNRALHAVILEIESERDWLWLESLSQSIDIVADADHIMLPVDCQAVKALLYQRNPQTQYEPLAAAPLAVVRTVVSQPTPQGWPQAYAFSDGRAYLDRIAEVGSSFEIVYKSRTPEELSTAVAAGDSNATLRLKEAIVIAGTAAHVATTFLRNEAEHRRQRMAFMPMMERLHNVEDAARSSQFGGGIMPDLSYHQAARGDY